MKKKKLAFDGSYISAALLFYRVLNLWRELVESWFKFDHNLNKKLQYMQPRPPFGIFFNLWKSSFLGYYSLAHLSVLWHSKLWYHGEPFIYFLFLFFIEVPIYTYNIQLFKKQILLEKWINKIIWLAKGELIQYVGRGINIQ